MVNLKKLLFVITLMVGCSLAAFGQEDDSGKTPDKKDPPKIIVGDKTKSNPKPTPKNNPDEKPPKKPDEQFSENSNHK